MYHTFCLLLPPLRECSKAVCKATYHHCKDKELRDSKATSYEAERQDYSVYKPLVVRELFQ